MTSTALNIVLSNARKVVDLNEIIEVLGQTRFKLDRYEIRMPHHDSDEEEEDMMFEHPPLIKWVSFNRPKIDLNFIVESNRQSYPYTTSEGKTVVIDFGQVKKTDGILRYALYENVENTNAFILTDDFLLDPTIQVVVTLVPQSKKWDCNVV